MARKKAIPAETPPQTIDFDDAQKAKVLADNADQLAGFAATALVTAELLRTRTMPLEHFWLAPDQRQVLLAANHLMERLQAGFAAPVAPPSKKSKKPRTKSDPTAVYRELEKPAGQRSIPMEQAFRDEACMDRPAETKTPGYSHTQRAPIGLILCAVTIYCVVLGWMIGDTLGMYGAGGVGLLFASLATCFHHLTVQDQGEVLGIRFGPLPMFRRPVRYADIVKVEVGRTLILDGWGIHRSIRGGCVWNLWDRDCVVIHFTKGVLRIGTDDAANLARFLEVKIDEQKT